MKKQIILGSIIIAVYACFALTMKKKSGFNSATSAPEIELISPSGKTIKLSNLKGKIVLIDFWASWCGPCRQENPKVVEAYKKYKKGTFINAKGFEVFSVSLDRDEKAWKNAIKSDFLIWKNHGIDKEGKAATLYGVSSIPSAFLVDGTGKIVAQGNELRGINLHIAIDKLIKIKK